MNSAGFAKWLTSTEWKGEKEGRKAHVWFATPGIVHSTLGKVKWRWNPEAIASCNLTFAEDLRSLALSDVLLGDWALQGSARKSAAVVGGKVGGLGLLGFSKCRGSILHRLGIGHQILCPPGDAGGSMLEI